MKYPTFYKVAFLYFIIFEIPINSNTLYAEPALISDITNTVNVFNYGAKGDGVSDDTIAIQAAIESLSGSGIVFLPEGKYIISSTICMSSARMAQKQLISKRVFSAQQRSFYY